MSRCFPYPPPGFEKKERSDLSSNSVAKEQQKERKHKKEKRDKEKKEGKEKKSKDKNRDKHKQKKDRKERHKDKKRDKDKNKNPDDKRIERQNGGHNEQKVESLCTEELGRRIEDENGASEKVLENVIGVSMSMLEQANNSRYAEELGRRIENGKKATANRMLETTGPLLKMVEGVDNSIAPKKERGNGKPVVANSVSKEQPKTNKVSHAMEKANHTHRPLLNYQRLPNVHPKVANFGKEQKRADAAEDKGNHNHQSLHDYQDLPNDNPKVANLSKEQRRTEAIGQPVEKSNHNHRSLHNYRGLPNGSLIIANVIKDKGRADRVVQGGEKGNHKPQTLSHQAPVLSNCVSIEQRINEIPPAEEKGIHNHLSLLQIPAKKDEVKSIEGKEQKKDSGAGDKHIREKESKKNKDKERNRDKKKGKEEKKKANGENTHKKQDTLGGSGKVNLKPRPSYSNENFAGNYGNSKKRKEVETNGFLHEDEGQPNKLPRPQSPSHQQNGKPLEFNHVHTSHPSISHRTPNNIVAERLMNDKGSMINGTTVTQPSPVDSRHLIAAETSMKNGTTVSETPLLDSRHLLAAPKTSKINGTTVTQLSPADIRLLLASNTNTINGDSRPPNAVNSGKKREILTKPPHPDSKFLSQVFSVPEMEQFVEYDGDDWLIGSNKHQPKTKEVSEAHETLQVWAQGLKIQYADVFALPYVIPY